MRLGGAAPQRSLPPCGDRERGAIRTASVLSLRSDERSQPLFESVYETSLLLCASSPPLSLSLPHKGEGTMWLAPSKPARCGCGPTPKVWAPITTTWRTHATGAAALGPLESRPVAGLHAPGVETRCSGGHMNTSRV